jgi:hypothetical protein
MSQPRWPRRPFFTATDLDDLSGACSEFHRSEESAKDKQMNELDFTGLSTEQRERCRLSAPADPGPPDQA